MSEAESTMIGALPAHQGALALDTYRLTKSFGAFTALDSADVKVSPGTVHALLGENGAGKSTLVKCVVGYQPQDEGSVLLDGRECRIDSPVMARKLGIGMVYQHFTVVPGLTVAENLLLARGQVPAFVDWKALRAELSEFLATTPFKLDLDAYPADMSAGQKQKLEILKQLFLKPRLLILDEPTSVLTPQEADEVLGLLRDRAHAGHTSVVMITHKFREVTAYADDVTVLRKGRVVYSGSVAQSSPGSLAEAMMGQAHAFVPPQRQGVAGDVVRLQLDDVQVMGDRAQLAVNGVSLKVHQQEIVGVAGVSGNGQRELMEALVGQRRRVHGEVQVSGESFHARREQYRRLRVRSLPEEPLRNACVAGMSVSGNLALRTFDQPPMSGRGWLRMGPIKANARKLIELFRVKTQGEAAPIRSLSGGNVQRAVLARELNDTADVLLISNPVFGLDFAAVSEVHQRSMEMRNAGSAVLLFSEDLDELLSLSDRIVVMSEGRLVYETPAADARREVLGRYMAGHESAHDTHAGVAA